MIDHGMSCGVTRTDIDIAGRRFVLRDLRAADMAPFLALHRRVFDSTVSSSWFEWKYVSGGGQGVGLWLDDALIAHCGGTPRHVLNHGVVSGYLQIGDVMVDPQWRGLLTRHGPFFHVCENFYNSRLGERGEFKVAYGFPNERHLRLAVKMGLSWDGGLVEALWWPLLAGHEGLPWNWRLQEFASDDPDLPRAVARSWASMQHEQRTQQLSVGSRDWRYLKWRFLDRPDRRYRFIAMQRPWSDRVAGVAVLHQPSEPGAPLQWLDWIGPTALMPLACRTCRLFSRMLGHDGLQAWASVSVLACLAGSGFTRRTVAAVLGIPVASAVSPESLKEMNWWFMGGDTDFL